MGKAAENVLRMRALAGGEFTVIAWMCLSCGNIFHTWPCNIKLRRFACSIECRPYTPPAVPIDRTGDKNPNWKGGQIEDGHGRAVVYIPGDPNATLYGGSHAYNYRIIAAKKIGRPLTEDEIVHHIDGDYTNDDPDNLQVMTQSEHASLHFTEMHAANRAAKTHCPKGHPFDEANTIIREDGKSRRCRICYKEQQRKAYIRRRDSVC